MNYNKLLQYKLAVSRLRDDSSEIFNYRITDGMGEIVVRTYVMLYKQITSEVDDEDLKALEINNISDMTDRQKVALVKLFAGQMKAYLEGLLEGT